MSRERLSGGPKFELGKKEVEKKKESEEQFDFEKLEQSGLINVREVEIWDDYSQTSWTEFAYDIHEDLFDNLNLSNPDHLDMIMNFYGDKLNYLSFWEAIKNRPDVKMSPELATRLFKECSWHLLEGGVQIFLDRLSRPIPIELIWTPHDSEHKTRRLVEYLNDEGKNLIINETFIRLTKDLLTEDALREAYSPSIDDDDPNAEILREFSAKYPKIYSEIGGLKWMSGRLRTSKKVDDWINALKRLTDTGNQRYLDALFGANGSFDDANIKAFIPYMDQYGNTIDGKLIDRFIFHRGKSEKEMIELEKSEGWEDYKVVQHDSDTFVAHIDRSKSSDLNEMDIVYERKRERVKNWERPLYRSVGFGSLYTLWKYGDLPLTQVRGHKETDAEPNSLVTFWSDTPIMDVPGSEIAVLSTTPDRWKKQPDIWKGRMRFVLEDNSPPPWEDYDKATYSSSIDEFYISTTVKDENISEKMLTTHATWMIKNFQEKIDLALSGKKRLLTNDIYVRQILEAQGDTFGQKIEEVDRETLQELNKFCEWLKDFEHSKGCTVGAKGHPVIKLLAPETFKKCPSYEGGIISKTPSVKV